MAAPAWSQAKTIPMTIRRALPATEIPKSTGPSREESLFIPKHTTKARDVRLKINGAGTILVGPVFNDGLFAGRVKNVGTGCVRLFVYRFVGQDQRRAGRNGLAHVGKKSGRNRQLLQQLGRIGRR
jgi:hypothetical protein